MPLPLEDYALLGDTHTAALVGRDGSVDWLCLPRFDSDACFAALLGGPEHGRWLLAPAGEHRVTGRRYRGDSLVLETDFATPDGAVRVVDCMPVAGPAAGVEHVDLLRRVVGVSGRVRIRTELLLRFGFGRTEPWLRSDQGRLVAVAGPHTVYLDGPFGTEHVASGTVARELEVAAGEAVDFQLSWCELGRLPAPVLAGAEVIDQTQRWWQQWADRCRYQGPDQAPVRRSLLTLKALTYAPSGGIVAAPTSSLPERLGGVRNWDYRFCWIRDATFTLLALLDAGYTAEAVAWREWLLRAVAGRPEQMQIMYGVSGERRLTEVEVGWLPGYEGSAPVRIGNAAAEQFQLDVYGELMDALHQARTHGIEPDPDAWQVQRELMDFLESHWRDPDEGIWEVRGPRQHFTHSKVMAWVAADRAVRAVTRFGLAGPVDRWRRLRAEIFAEVCARGYHPDRQTFTQFYGSPGPDASLLLIPAVGFLPASDPRVAGTVAAVERELCQDGFVHRYRQSAGTAQVDGLPPGEGAFLTCTFWLADAHALAGDTARARAVYARVLGLCNDVGLLAEEYDVARRRMVGNFPQALSHLQLVETAGNLSGPGGPSHQRAQPE
jgi:GH15 family glucan-1,4-alpha-glucosidase